MVLDQRLDENTRRKKINFNFNNLTIELSHLYWNILKISQKKEPKNENNGEENEMITMKWMNK